VYVAAVTGNEASRNSGTILKRAWDAAGILCILESVNYFVSY
jgi:hypothetical protein